MKKTTKKTTSKPRATKAIKDLDVKRAKEGKVRGGGVNHNDFPFVKYTDSVSR